MPTTILIGAINIVVASLLLAVYRGVYIQTRAHFSLGLFLVAAAFFAQNLLVVYALYTMMSLVPSPLDPYLFGTLAFEAVGLGAMLWTATR